MEFKKDKGLVLWDNINIRFEGYGWENCYTTWLKDKKEHTYMLQNRLIEIMEITMVTKALG